MHVKPDLIAIIRLKKGKLGMIIAECKVGSIGVNDFRQAIDYAMTCRSYDAYLIFHGSLTRDNNEN